MIVTKRKNKKIKAINNNRDLPDLYKKVLTQA